MDEFNHIRTLFHDTFGKFPENIVQLPLSGSNRKYYRLVLDKKTFIAVKNEDIKENKAFIEFTNHFFSLGLNVPEVLATDLPNNVYLLQDLGDSTLLSYIEKDDDGNLSAESLEMYKKVLTQLPLFQINGGKTLDYSACYPRAAFDKQSMMWDLNYFKYYFLKLAQVSFDEQLLEDDFQSFSDFLLQADCSYFLYRDFQSRNVMIVDNEPYFIDYQGGRRGALQYDIASILFEAKTSLTASDRATLLSHYINELSKQIKINPEQFTNYFYGYVYIRMMQAMGAYGFRGLYEKKELFLQSIPKALEHLQWLRSNVKLPIRLPELEKVWENLVVNEHIRGLAQKTIGLTVRVNSFSYKRGIPIDETQNGGGFVFDCRALENPGRYDEYKQMTGLDQPVIDFLQSKPDVSEFTQEVIKLVTQSVNKYSERNFTHLMVSFGCTGGQHRSVFMAEALAGYLKKAFPSININIRHREMEMKKA